MTTVQRERERERCEIFGFFFFWRPPFLVLDERGVFDRSNPGRFRASIDPSMQR